MKVISIVDEDFINYKKPSMYLIMPYCTFKCDYECGRPICQNSALAHEPTVQISSEDIIKRYDANPISKAIVFGGLEPFDSIELSTFIMFFRQGHYDDIVIYTGYTEEEVKEKFPWIFLYENIIIKFGRFVPDQESHYDEVLGVKLASPNQYAKRVE